RQAWRSLGMDVVRLQRLSRVQGVPVRRVLRGLLRRRVPGAARRLLGDRPARRTHHVSELGLPATAAALQRCPVGGRRMSVTAEIDVLVSPEERNTELREEVRDGLTSTPKELEPKWFYDERGSELFEAITQLPEYYLTRAERSILERHAGEIAALANADTLIELGSGTSDKTRLLLDAVAPRRFVPFDVSEETLRASAQKLAREYPALEVRAVVGDFEHHLPLLPGDGRRLLAFLGSTIGNLPPARRTVFLSTVAATLHDGDTFLLGVDLVKSPERLLA